MTPVYLNRIDKAVWRGLIGVIVIPTLTFLVLIFWPLNPIEIKSVKIMNKNRTVVSGEDIIFQVHYVKHTKKHGKVYRQLLNDRVVNYRPHISSVPTGEKKGIGFLHTGDEEKPGLYQVSYTVVYRYFGFRDVSVTGLSDEFTVIPREK